MNFYMVTDGPEDARGMRTSPAYRAASTLPVRLYLRALGCADDSLPRDVDSRLYDAIRYVDESGGTIYAMFEQGKDGTAWCSVDVLQEGRLLASQSFGFSASGTDVGTRGKFPVEALKARAAVAC